MSFTPNPANLRPFPISVVAMGPGSQGDDAPEYLVMPQGMETFQHPRLPEGATTEAIEADASLLTAFVDQAAERGFAGGAQLNLLAIDTAAREVINQSLGFGEVSAFTTSPEHWRSAGDGICRLLACAKRC